MNAYHWANRPSPVVTGELQSAHQEFHGRILLVANLPYNVASPMIMNLITDPITIDGMYVKVQKEVAVRMIAVSGSSDYGTLSIHLGATGKVKTIRTLKPTAFYESSP